MPTCALFEHGASSGYSLECYARVNAAMSSGHELSSCLLRVPRTELAWHERCSCGGMRFLATLLFAAVTTGAALACSPSDQTDEQGGDESSALEGADRARFYHLSEGSEFFPYAAIRALEVSMPDGRRVPLLSPENLTRYGLLPDTPSALNPDGLPIGITLARSPESGLISLGVNCAACHVGRVDVRDASGVRSHVIDGIPNMFDLKGFYDDIAKELVTRWENPTSRESLTFVARSTKELAEVAIRYRNIEDNDFEWKMSPADKLKVMWQLLVSSVKLATGEKSPAQVIERLDLPPARKRLLSSRARFFEVVMNDPGGTPGGPGRADAFGTLKNQLFPTQGPAAISSAPTSAPSLFHIANREWFHANANTNSVLQRNILQALGVGGVVDSVGPEATYVSSVNLKNVHALEQMTYGFRPPAWPGPAPDQALVARGRDVYVRECAGCHEPTLGENGLYRSKETRLDEVGTDREHAVNFMAELDGQTFVSRNGPMTDAVAKNYFDRNGISAVERAAWSGVRDAALNPNGKRAAPRWKADLTYMARPLDGVWATAPYLHNASVPTLADLLEPAAARPKKFYLGHRLYDLDKVGYAVITSPDPSSNAHFAFDTTLPGNSNAGHEYGATMPHEDKRALLAFLKGFGAGAAAPVRVLP